MKRQAGKRPAKERFKYYKGVIVSMSCPGINRPKKNVCLSKKTHKELDRLKKETGLSAGRLIDLGIEKIKKAKIDV